MPEKNEKSPDVSSTEDEQETESGDSSNTSQDEVEVDEGTEWPLILADGKEVLVQLHAQVQPEVLYLWARSDKRAPTKPSTSFLAGAHFLSCLAEWPLTALSAPPQVISRAYPSSTPGWSFFTPILS